MNFSSVIIYSFVPQRCGFNQNSFIENRRTKMSIEKNTHDGGQVRCQSCAPKFLTVKQYAERYPYPSESALRWMLFHSSTNGLESAVIRVGRRIILDLDALNAWLRSQKG
jgi:hypothetical protein